MWNIKIWRLIKLFRLCYLNTVITCCQVQARIDNWLLLYPPWNLIRFLRFQLSILRWWWSLFSSPLFPLLLNWESGTTEYEDVLITQCIFVFVSAHSENWMAILISYPSILFAMLSSHGLVGMGSLFLMCMSILMIDLLERASLCYGGLFRLLMGWCLVGKMFLIAIDSLLLDFSILNSLSSSHLSILKHTKYPF